MVSDSQKYSGTEVEQFEERYISMNKNNRSVLEIIIENLATERLSLIHI